MLNFPLWKKLLVALLCLGGVVYAAPNFIPPSLLADVPLKRINLGLDLQGGAHLLFRVETAAVLRERMEGMVETTRQTLRENRIRYTSLGALENSVAFTLGDPAQAGQALELLRDSDPTLEITADGNGRVSLSLPEQALRQEVDQLVAQSIEVIRRRIDEDGTKEPVIQRQGEDRILVQVPGAEDTEAVKRKIGRTAKMTFHLLDSRASPTGDQPRRAPPGAMLLPSVETGPDGTPQRYYLVEKRTRVGGEHLKNAQPVMDQNNRPAVSFQFDTQGGRMFGALTTENVGRPLAIVLDGAVISAPVIQQPIIGGNGIITGQFTVRETTELALLLRAGALPAPFTVLEERSVGPGLGQDSIAAGELACIIALALVGLYMLLAYGLFGVMANIALLLNISLVLAILTLLQATLTLPGIAGIALTVGMAIDANVLVFARIREEHQRGRNIAAAIDTGYRRALGTVLDANLTTLIAAILLFAFGSGPIKGFAVTLAIGIVTSVFAAMMITRWMVVSWYIRKRPKSLPI